MKIYVAHSTGFNYKEELYKPIRDSLLNSKHEIVLPHEDSSELFDSKSYLNNCDVLLAEVSLPSTGVGIELGWANLKQVRIICMYKVGSKPSSSLKAVTNEFVEYSLPEDLISKLEAQL
jgi:hypothetical protein